MIFWMRWMQLCFLPYGKNYTRQGLMFTKWLVRTYWKKCWTELVWPRSRQGTVYLSISTSFLLDKVDLICNYDRAEVWIISPQSVHWLDWIFNWWKVLENHSRRSWKINSLIKEAVKFSNVEHLDNILGILMKGLAIELHNA